MTLRRLLPWGALIAVLVTLSTAAPALAHTELKRSTPAEGATLTAPPTTVSLTFGEAVTLRANPIRVTGPGGVAWTVGKATISGATVTAPVAATGPAGAYTLSWQVVADDGDTVQGVVHFTMAAAPPPSTTAAPATTAVPTTASTPATTAVAAAPTTDPAVVPAAASSGGVPGWVWVLVGVVVVAVAGGLVVARSRRS